MVSELQSIPASMAKTTSASTFTIVPSTSTTMPLTSTSTSINLTNQPLLLLSNMSNMMVVKLSSSNYIVWKHQISMVLETYSMFELLDEVPLVPKKFLKDLSSTITSVLNPDYLIWKSKENALLTFISSTPTPSVLAIIVGCSLAQEVWMVLENRFSSISRSPMMTLKGEMHNDDEELLHVAIKGFSKEFSAFRSAIRTRSTKLSFDELATLLNAKEESLNEGMEIKDSTFAMAVNIAPRFDNTGGYNNHNQSNIRGRGRNNNGRGRGRGSSPNQFN
ncbi:hypothetical protein SO802_025932 [Lithocarpus litseifolius]|uniref:Retrotransposon Copia-like N-terminal domain-containing protein n=1 Tax=Lithocarpus litseifolius TaxID=425828 RepID=A0AAW2C0N6_9ROSI